MALFFTAHLYFPSLTAHMNPAMTVTARIKQMIGFFVEKNALLGFLATVFIIMGQFMVIPFISPYLVSNLGFGEENLPFLYLLGGLASIFTVPLIGKLTDKHTAFKVFPIGTFISIVPLFALTHLTTSNKIYILATTTLFMICMGGRMVPFMAMITQVVEPHKRGTYLSLTASIQALAQGSAALLASAIVGTGTQGKLIGYGAAGWLAAFFSILTIVLGYQIAKAAKRSEQQTHSKMPSQPQPTLE
jgi:predicted MFS family arabinose efflux permease